ncbi:ABC transporter permease [Streptomyces sp. NPDC048611]|uniref:ABC transporter permease n=1 Tax=Streptomyces sp. NPDC048611 TaxID=3155635 RepID=UPI003427BC96
MTTTAHLGANGTGPVTGGPGAGREPGGRGRLRGLGWLVWRQHRLFFGLLLAAVVGGAAWCVVLRGRMAGFIASHHIDGCSLISLVPRCEGTQEAVTEFRGTYGWALQLAEMGLLLLPVLIGLFLGAPLIARELEAGTHQLVLTQSVGPLRWLAAKAALPALVVLSGVTALSAVFTWMWQAAGDEVSGAYWYSTTDFAVLGPVPVAYALLGLAVGVLAGLLLRRTVPTMGVTLGAMILAPFVLKQIRPYLMPIRTAEFGPEEAAQLPDNAWLVGQGHYTRSGAHLPDNVCDSFGDYESCLRARGVVGQYMDYQPASHHWPLAWIESGLVLAVVAVLTVIAFRVMRRRHG